MTTAIQTLLLRHYQRYPRMQAADFIKLIYQQEFGPGHMIDDENRALAWIEDEAQTLPRYSPETTDPRPLHVDIGNGLSRLDLAVIHQGLAPTTLSRIFTLTANHSRGSHASFEAKVAELHTLCTDGRLPLDPATITELMTDLRARNYPAIHHSQTYRDAYAPAYRVVETRFCELLDAFLAIDRQMAAQAQVVCAIEGRCAAGKSTLAATLSTIYRCNVFTMDDFFLQPHQRTPERFAEPGGNVDYERFRNEILEPLTTGQAVSYHPYDCSIEELVDPIDVPTHRLSIIEGVYSLHPSLSDFYTLKLFLTIQPEEQRQRLFARNEALYQRFIDEWIPLEERYFAAYAIEEQCDLILEAGETV